MATSNAPFKGVMLNAYPDSIGTNLKEIISVLERDELREVFSLFYVLPTFFNSDLDRGFSVIDYDINRELVEESDLDSLKNLGIKLKFDIVLNHLSVASPQFKDLLKNGKDSIYKDFFINWNDFWQGEGTLSEEGVIIPHKEHLSKLFMRKSGLPILKVLFPDGSEQPYWNTFYQKISYNPLELNDFISLDITQEEKERLCAQVNSFLKEHDSLDELEVSNDVLEIIHQKRTYLGQMDVNAKSELVWDFYEDTLKKVSEFGCEILRLDAFAYLHKEIGAINFFNIPGTWEYLERIRKIANKYQLVLLPEIHAEYGLGLHDEVASKGYQIYDFFLPGLTIHTLETASTKALKKWIVEIVAKKYQTVNMLGCHDGIPVLDLKGKEIEGTYHEGLLNDDEIQHIMNVILDRGGRVKNLYDAQGNKISYYQVNATFYSALGENDKKMLLARAIQLFMPGIPQVWYLDLFAGKNDYEAVDRGGKDAHKEINRTNLSLSSIEEGLQKEVVKKQLELLRLRNTSAAFQGEVSLKETSDSILDICWTKASESVQLIVDFNRLEGTILVNEAGIEKVITL